MSKRLARVFEFVDNYRMILGFLLGLFVCSLAHCQLTIYSDQFRPVAWSGTSRTMPVTGTQTVPFRIAVEWSASGHLVDAYIQQFTGATWGAPNLSSTSDSIPPASFLYHKIRESWCGAGNSTLDYSYSMTAVPVYYPNGNSRILDFAPLNLENEFGCKFIAAGCDDPALECVVPGIDFEDYEPPGWGTDPNKFWGSNAGFSFPATSMTNAEAGANTGFAVPVDPNPQPEGYAMANYPGAGGATVVVSAAFGVLLEDFEEGERIIPSPNPESYVGDFSDEAHWVREVTVLQGGAVVGQSFQAWDGVTWRNQWADEYALACECTMLLPDWGLHHNHTTGGWLGRSWEGVIDELTGGGGLQDLPGGTNWVQERMNDFSSPFDGSQEYQLPEGAGGQGQDGVSSAASVAEGIAQAEQTIYNAVGNATGEVADAQTDSLKGETGIGDGKSLKDVVDAIDGLSGGGGGGGLDIPSAEDVGNAVADASAAKEDGVAVGSEGAGEVGDGGFLALLESSVTAFETELREELNLASVPTDAQNMQFTFSFDIPGAGPTDFQFDTLPDPADGPTQAAFDNMRQLFRLLVLAYFSMLFVFAILRRIGPNV